MQTKIGIKQLSGIPGGEGNYIGCVSTFMRTLEGKREYTNEFRVTHVHFCSSDGRAYRDCFDPKIYDKDDYEFDSEFFNGKKRSGHTLDMCHYESMDLLKKFLLDRK